MTGYCCILYDVHHIEQSIDQQNNVINPVRGQLHKNINISLSSFTPENLVS